MSRKVLIVLVALIMACNAAWADDGTGQAGTVDTTAIIQGILNSSASNGSNTGNLSLPGGTLNILQLVNALQGGKDINGIMSSLQNSVNLSTIFNNIPGGFGILNSAGGGNSGQALVNGLIYSIFSQGNTSIPAELQNMLNNGGADGSQNMLRFRTAPSK